ncbi:hypothetical protein KSS87_023879 [Heliosperma pusillum]|nr:hypothetical protein KSS87_023879 [Heliosperma pusillum]
MDENSKIGGEGGPPKATSTTTIVADDRNPNSNGEVTATSNGGDAVESGSEAERAYMMLSMGGAIGYGRWDTGLYVHDDEDDGFGDSHDHEYDDVDDEGDEDDEEEDEDNVENYEDEDDDEDEDAFDIHAHADFGDDDSNRVDLDPSAFPDDEAYARALQDAEEREMAVRLMAMAGITEREVVDVEDHGSNSQDTWEEVDPDELSYEELIALGEVVGTESRGLSADTIASLPSTNYKSQKSEEAETDSCVICRLDYEDDDALTTLPCMSDLQRRSLNIRKQLAHVLKFLYVVIAHKWSHVSSMLIFTEASIIGQPVEEPCT